MNKNRLAMIALAAGLAFSAAAHAQVWTRGDYQARVDAIAASYRLARADCAALAGRPKSICVAEAKARGSIARADLEAHYRPSAQARYRALGVAADSRHTLAKVHCEEQTGLARTGCVTQATSDRTDAWADATARLESAEANARAAEVAAEEREEAAADTFDARYTAARQQCDGYAAGRIKGLCLVQTQDRFLSPGGGARQHPTGFIPASPLGAHPAPPVFQGD